MKKILKLNLILMVLFVFIMGTSNVFAIDIKQESLSVADKSSTITINNDGIGDLEISPDIEFNEVGDYITYKLVLKNTDGKKYKVVSIEDDNEDEYIKTSYKYDNELNTDDKEILITLKYEKEFRGNSHNIKTIKVAIKLVDEEEKEQEVVVNNTPQTTESSNNLQTTENSNTPKTGDGIEKYIALFVISGLVLIAIHNRKINVKKHSKGKHVKGLFILLFAISIIPAMAFANETKDITFTINVQNIKINGYYTVAFDTDGGNEIESQIVKHNNTVELPTNPTKEGHNFVKWVDETGADYDFTTPITRDITLKAKWEKKEYTVAFNTDGGSNVAEQTVKHGEKAIKPADPTKTGYTIDNWYIDGTFGTVFDFNTPIKSNTTIYAKWNLENYTITYNLDGGTVAGTNRETYTIETEDFTLVNPTKEGHNFKGWTGPNGNTPEQLITIRKGTTGNKEYTAVFEQQEYTVSFNSDGGSSVAEQTVKHGEKATRPADPAKEGYRLAKWVDETGAEYRFTTPVTGDITLKAEWRETVSTFDLGTTVNRKIKRVAGDIVTGNNSYTDLKNKNIKAIKKATELPTNFVATENNTVSTDTSDEPIYIWFDADTIYYYSESKNLKLNSDCQSIFVNFTALEDFSDLPPFDGENLREAFEGCEKLVDISPLANWDVSQVTNFMYLFQNCKNLTNISAIKNWEMSQANNLGYMFNNTNISNLEDLKEWGMTDLNSLRGTFGNCKNLTNINGIKNWNVLKVNDISLLFTNCTSLVDISPLANWGDISGISYMEQLFSNCKKLEDIQILSNWDISNKTSLNGVFRGCEKLTDLTPIEGWDVSGVTNFDSLFDECKSLADLTPLEKWDTSSALSMQQMFRACEALRDISPLSRWDTSKVTTMMVMFADARKIDNLDGLSGWDVSNVKKFNGMFKYTSTSYSLSDASGIENWDIDSTADFREMFAVVTGMNSNNKPIVICNPVHPNFTKVPGMWEVDSGTFIPD